MEQMSNVIPINFPQPVDIRPAFTITPQVVSMAPLPAVPFEALDHALSEIERLSAEMDAHVKELRRHADRIGAARGRTGEMSLLSESIAELAESFTMLSDMRSHCVEHYRKLRECMTRDPEDCALTGNDADLPRYFYVVCQVLLIGHPFIRVFPTLAEAKSHAASLVIAEHADGLAEWSGATEDGDGIEMQWQDGALVVRGFLVTPPASALPAA
jgi:hypothetical protein